jgi:multidrug resistance protein MdtO
MNVKPTSPSSIAWLYSFWQDLQPTPGRINSTLRLVLSSLILLLLLLILQMPFASYGLYAIFVIGGESPSVSLRTGISSLLLIALAIFIEIGVVVLTDNDPMARVLSVAVVAFIAGMFLVCTSLPALGSIFGFFYCVFIAFWEGHSPEDTLVKNSLFLLGTFSLAVGCTVAVEYVFGDRSPADLLAEQFNARYRALEAMFGLYAQDDHSKQRFDAAARVSQLAAAGQAGMMRLFNQIVDRNLDPGILPIATRVHITMLAELMDHSAAFGLQDEHPNDPEFRSRCACIAEECGRLVTSVDPQLRMCTQAAPPALNSLLDRVEATLHSILAMPVNQDVPKNKELAALPSNQVPLLIPGAIGDRDNIAFGLKISLCATLCYILYHAIDWAGTSTSVTTVMVAGLSTTGAMKQRLALRLLGATIGGLVLGIGATAFLFPYMDSITSLVILIGLIAFIGGWISRGPKFNYVGLQILFAFYLVAFEGFSAPTQLAPARDRFVGILFAIIVMWFIFDRVWPVRTVTAMRRVLGSVLSSGARLFRVADEARTHEQLIRESESLRDRLGKNISALRNLSEAVEYEFGVDREEHIRSSEMMLQISMTAAALIWNQVAVFHDEFDSELITTPDLAEMRRSISNRMNSMAESASRKTELPTDLGSDLISPSSLKHQHYGEYARNTIARFEDLRRLASALTQEA